MKTDFRALCAELADAYLRTLEHINNSTWLGYEPSDDLLLQRTRAVLAEADEPAVPIPPADGEVAELVAFLREQVHVCLQVPWTPGIKHFGRAASLLEQRYPTPVPVSVSERPWERQGWCDAEGMCWWGRGESDDWFDAWTLATFQAVAESYQSSQHTHCLPAHALPRPEVNND